jgi:hypothetical protein
MDDFAGAPAAGDHVADGLADLDEVRLVPIEQAQGNLAVGDYRRKWLHHLVGDRGGQLAQGRHAGDVGQLRLGPI